MTDPRIAAEFTIRTDSGPIKVTLWRRDRADPHGPRHGSIAQIRLDTAALGVSLPDNRASDDGGPLDQAGAAYNTAELGAIHALLAVVMPKVQARTDDAIIPALGRPTGTPAAACAPARPAWPATRGLPSAARSWTCTSPRAGRGRSHDPAYGRHSPSPAARRAARV